MAKDQLSGDDAWQAMLEGSEDLAEEIGVHLGARDKTQIGAILAAADRWAAGVRPLDEEQAERLGCLLARVLTDAHDGGLRKIDDPDHPLDGEWVVTGFARGLESDYAVPFMVSATRIGEGTLTAREWYRQLVDEGSASPS